MTPLNPVPKVNVKSFTETLLKSVVHSRNFVNHSRFKMKSIKSPYLKRFVKIELLKESVLQNMLIEYIFQHVAEIITAWSHT